MRINEFYKELNVKPVDMRKEFVVCSRYITNRIFRLAIVGFTAEEIECFVRHILKQEREAENMIHDMERIKEEKV